MRIVTLIPVGIVFVIGMLFTAPSSVGAGGPESLQGLPLWKLLPTKEYATVLDQTSGKVRAGVYVYRRPRARSGPQKVCIQQVVAYRLDVGRVSIVTTGGECSEWGSAEGVSFTLGRFEKNSRTVVGLVTAEQSAHRMEVAFEDGNVVSRHIPRLSQSQAMKANLPRLRVSAALLPGVECVESITALDERGKVVAGTGERGCAPLLLATRLGGDAAGAH